MNPIGAFFATAAAVVGLGALIVDQLADTTSELLAGCAVVGLLAAALANLVAELVDDGQERDKWR